MLEDLDCLMEKHEVDTLLATGNAFEDPNIFWLTGFRSPDHVIYLRNRGEEGLIAAALNTLDRVTKESFIKKTHDLSDVYLEMLEEGLRVSKHHDRLYESLLDAEFSGGCIGIPDEFPASHLMMLLDRGYDVKVVPDLVREARATKSSREFRMIRKSGKATVEAINVVLDVIQNAEVGDNRVLMHKGQPLTVGRTKLVLEQALLERQAESAEDAIVAVGRRGFDWHYLGKPSDKLRSGLPIIMDVFPRLKLDRYVADVTRTVVRGKPRPKVEKMFEAVVDALGMTEDALTHGAVIEDVNLACYETLQKHGFDSRHLNPDAKEGMTHGLGHGIGLEVHEEPSLYDRDKHFSEGHVVAIEPGVYLRSVGGVRVENDYVVTKRKPRLLTPGVDRILFL
ncbi:aminopeptidase P family protein [Candidatus Thorarchaeota archaeon]|nr:MAG: aminopeptidase P family protein [Candidatus Thorarchaeota archaeon]